MSSLLMVKHNFTTLNVNKKNCVLVNSFLIKKELNSHFNKLMKIYYLKFKFYLINFKKLKAADYFIHFNLIKLNKTMLFLFCGFMYAKIFLKVGLGFRKKYSLTTNLYNLLVGKRK